ncbi:MAG TPA: DUF3365 domain-containing protein [Gammaproteobacteria bacterium]|nr:DUF3365 domain-containing protein [Gammaproteobacteria bacterium]HRP86388.1 DUF3365 domain-containing protein [Gammaproteobacteria bacterium]
MNARVSRLCVAAVACVAAATAVADAPDRAAEGRAMAGQFGAELRTALQDAMAAGGPIAAIKVCNEDAPRIAAAAAQASGATVGRTSLKLRNPDNRPDEHERAVLEEFAAAVAANPGAPPPERLDTLADGRVRFMSAIIVQPPCLACHGDALAPPVAAAIGALYPDDQARGYQAGELRGAFTITWPAD